jgi:predicted Zn-dependent protease
MCFLFQMIFTGPASALDIGNFLGEVSGALDRVNATLDRAIGGVNQANQKVLDASRDKAPQTTAFLGKWEQSWEVSMGKSTHESLREKPGFSRDKALLERLGSVARRLVKHVDRKDLSWNFAVLDTDEVNAFAAPGGYIYVTRGLMNLVESEDELAGVVAHEIGHVDRKHSVRQAEKSGLMTALVIGLGLNKKTKDAAPVAAIAAYFANLKFSRDDEYEADACAVKYTHAAGYRPQGLVTFFNKINRDSSSTKVTKYFSTHPPTTDRIKAVEKQIARLQAGNTQTTQAKVNQGASDSGQIKQTTASSGNSAAKVTTAELQQAYETYLYYQQLYQYKVQQQAPMNEVMDVFNKYQTAKKRYTDLRRAVGS